MSDNVTVSNAPTSTNPDIAVRTLDKSGEQIQVVAIDYGGAGAENLSTPDFATESTLLNINTALSGGIQVSVNSDVLGSTVIGQRSNEIELSFFSSFNSNLITNTTASGGTATITNGHARYRTGTNATGAAKGSSVYQCKYRPAHEQYVFFTAAFTTGVANSYQRIGLFDANNGFFVGYEGTSFGVSLRSGTADTFTARASWNGDPLDGLTGSKFTRGGVPEAINLTYSNLYRIRFAWLGSATIVFEVFSPDSIWITFHTIRIPNSQLNPSIQTPQLPVTIDIAKTSGASDLSLYSACMAAGTTSDVAPINETLNQYSLAKLTRSVLTGETTAGGGNFVNVKVNPSGSLTTAIGDITDIVGQQVMADSVPVVIASNQSAIPVTGTLSISTTGLATDTNQVTEIGYLTSIDGNIIKADTDHVTISSAIPAGTNNIGDVDVVTLPTVVLATQTNPFSTAIPISDNAGSITVDGTVAATQSGTWNIADVTGTISLPTGAATESTLSTLNGKIPASLTVTSTRLLVDNSGVTQPISASSLPLPTGAATAAKQPALGTAGTASSDVITVQGIASMTALKVDGSAVTQPVSGTVTANAGSGTFAVSAASLPLPTGAATSAKQPALGTAGTPSSDVITVQGTASMTALKVDGSGVTQPVSGTVTANAGTGTFAVSAASLPLPSGAATETTLSALNTKVTACNTGAVTISAALPAGTNAIGTVAATQSGTWNITNVSGTVSLPTGAATESTLSTLNGKVTACNTGAVTVSSQPASVFATYSTTSVTSVTAAASSTSILASNANRRMAILFNDCDKNAYVKLGTTASTTSFSYKLTPYQTLELPVPVYTGAIDAIWDASPTGAMRVTEIS